MAETLPFPRRHGSNITILVVDDCDVIQKVVKRYLSKAGVDVTAAQDGKDGLTLTARAHDSGNPFDLILMNMQMPGLEGCEVTRTLRSEGYEGLIIALTADPDREKCIDGGCNDYLPKPFDESQLISLLEQYGICLELTG